MWLDGIIYLCSLISFSTQLWCRLFQWYSWLHYLKFMGQKIGLRSGSELPAAAGGDSGSAAQWEKRSISIALWARRRTLARPGQRSFSGWCKLGMIFFNHYKNCNFQTRCDKDTSFFKHQALKVTKTFNV